MGASRFIKQKNLPSPNRPHAMSERTKSKLEDVPLKDPKKFNVKLHSRSILGGGVKNAYDKPSSLTIKNIGDESRSRAIG